MFGCIPGFARGFFFGPFGTGWSNFGFIMFWVRPIISFGLFILMLYIIYKLFFSHRLNFVPKNRNLEILTERFVKGEISEEEYKRMKEIVQKE